MINCINCIKIKNKTRLNFIRNKIKSDTKNLILISIQKFKEFFLKVIYLTHSDLTKWKGHHRATSQKLKSLKISWKTYSSKFKI